MGPGMMGGYGGWGNYGQRTPSEACQKFLADTAGLRKELHTKRFDYYEEMTNPKASPETLSKLDKEIRDLQGKIYEKGPQACAY
jgi:hypothetical protein